MTRSLDNAKNIARGALTLEGKEARVIVGEAFAALTPLDRQEFFKWLIALPISKKILYCGMPAKEFGELRIDGIEEQLDFDSQIDWVVRVLQTHESQLESYIYLRGDFEELWLSGDYEAAYHKLDAIDATAGMSFWSIDVRLCLLNDWKGLEGQKAFSSSIQNDYPRTAVAYFTALTSQRNEDKTNLHRFVDRVIGRSLPPYMKAYAKYLLSKIPPDDDSCGGVLNAAANASPIDAYEALVDLIVKKPAKSPSRTNAGHHISKLKTLAEVDYRLRRLSHHITEPGRAFILPVQPETLPSPEAFYLNAAGLMSCELKSEHQFIRKTSEAFGEIWREGGLTASLLGELEKTLVNHSGLSFFKILSGMYAIDRIGFDHNNIFSLSEVAHSLPGTSVLGSVIDEPDQLFLITKDAVDPWFSECLVTTAIFNGVGVNDEIVSAWIQNVKLSTPLRGARFEAYQLAKTGKLSPALDLVASYCCEHPGRRYLFPLAALLPVARWSDISEHRASIALPIFLSLLHQVTANEEVEKLLRVAFGEYVKSSGVDTPSRLFGLLPSEQSTCLKYFLKEIALTNTLDAIGKLKTTRALDDERIAINQALIELDPPNAGTYTAEIMQLVKYLNIADGLSDVDSSRIHVEVEPLYRIAEENYGETFRRYSEMRKASIGFGSPEEFERILREYTKQNAALFEQFLERPEQEGDQLLIEVVNGITDLFLHDHVHGLDVYLSMRIRHGSLGTNLRAPLEACGIHLPEKTDDNSDALLKGVPTNEVRQAHGILREFTRRYEKAIANLLKDKVQIRTSPSETGLFDFSKMQVVIASAKNFVQADTTFRGLFKHVLDTLVIYLTLNLKAMREHVEGEFRHEIEKCFDALRRSLNDASLPNAGSRISFALNQALPDVNATIDRISGWFSVGEAAVQQLRSFEDTVDIAMLAVNRAHRNFSPVLTKKIDDLGLQSIATFNETLDALFPILENIAEHWGANASPNVDIAITAGENYDVDGQMIVVRVVSDIRPDTDITAVESKLSDIRLCIESGDYRKRVRGEGGTGLLKIYRMVTMNERQKLYFGFTQNGRFFVEFHMAIRYLAPQAAEELGLS